MEMKKEELERLYKELIIPESRSPYRFARQESESILAYNPICGDKFRIYPGETVHFHGHGCALSKASGSLLMRLLDGKPLMSREDDIRSFLEAVESGNAETLPDDKLSLLVALKKHEGREACILLTWRAMLDHIHSKKTDK
jgi:nitrogen fixation NifU-like protein